mmetsp:Transcript_43421/g.89534  ORF Transcript_43421/g.89534 Transcript_43421/m.89534 type:complete len:97 (-) Transcript_43421:105-395(-)
MQLRWHGIASAASWTPTIPLISRGAGWYKQIRDVTTPEEGELWCYAQATWQMATISKSCRLLAGRLSRQVSRQAHLSSDHTGFSCWSLRQGCSERA